MKIRVQINGKKVTLSEKQVSRIVALATAGNSGSGEEIPAPNVQETAPNVREGDLVAASMPRHPRVIVSRVHHFDRDGEARGSRGEHLGYFNRRSAHGQPKLTLCTVLRSGPLADSLKEAFPALNNPAR